MSATKPQDAWIAIADHYRRIGVERAGEGPGVQLACLVLAEYCAHLWAGNLGGPTLAMVALAEHAIGDRIDEIVATELAKMTAARGEALS